MLYIFFFLVELTVKQYSCRCTANEQLLKMYPLKGFSRMFIEIFNCTSRWMLFIIGKSSDQVDIESQQLKYANQVLHYCIVFILSWYFLNRKKIVLLEQVHYVSDQHCQNIISNSYPHTLEYCPGKAMSRYIRYKV